MLTLTRVTKRFGNRAAVNDLTMKVPEGMIFGLLGPNGSGKTTALRMVMGLLAPTAGDIRLFGKHAPSDSQARAKIGYMPQRLAIYPELTIAENTKFFARIYGADSETLEHNSAEILELVALWDRRDDRVSTLSGGMVRRVMLATTLVHKPRLLILDEPTAGVDPLLRLKFWDWFESLAQNGTSIIITTHHISEANRCHQVAFMRDGGLIDEGSPNEIMAKYECQDLEAAFVVATQAEDRT